MKDELMKLRNDRELYNLRISMMWERLEFQERIYYKINIDNVTVDQVIKMYKEQLTKMKANFKNNEVSIKK